MIAISVSADCNELSDLYEQWVGRKADLSHDRGNSVWLAARDNDGSKSRIVGALQLIIMDDPVRDRKWGLIENVFVTKSYRRHKVATDLLESAKRVAIDKGCVFLKLMTEYDKAGAPELYRSLGYEEGLSFRVRKEIK